MKKILTIVGARPQFIKAAAFSLKLKEYSTLTEDLLHTGQHYDDKMSQVFFDELKIPRPKFQLSAGGGTHSEQTALMLTGIEEVLINNKYDLVLVYGDTNSTLAGSLVAAKLHIPTAHVEAGLRSFNRKMPEEINRIVTDHCSQYLFAPTKTAMKNLEVEGLLSKSHMVGDIMYDATRLFAEKSRMPSNVVAKEYYLVTLHRAENVDSAEFLTCVFDSFKILESKKFVLPVHPRLKNNLAQHKISVSSNVQLIDPVSYLEMLKLEKNAQAILTDSGGVQKEAFFQEVPCLTLRTETEWVETIEHGWNSLADLKSASALASQIEKLSKPTNSSPGLYGDGNTAGKIAEILLKV